MTWGGLPMGEPRAGICVDCGGTAAPRYEHCDGCLKAAAAAVYARYRREHPRRIPGEAEMVELLRDSHARPLDDVGGRA